MIKVNYGEKVSEETVSQIAELLKGEGIHFESGIPEEIILGIMQRPGDKVLDIASGATIEEACRCLPDNADETIDEAAVVIRGASGYRFLPKELASLIGYFDSYPKDPRITWKYCHDSRQEHPVTILLLKNISGNA